MTRQIQLLTNIQGNSFNKQQICFVVDFQPVNQFSLSEMIDWKEPSESRK